MLFYHKAIHIKVGRQTICESGAQPVAFAESFLWHFTIRVIWMNPYTVNGYEEVWGAHIDTYNWEGGSVCPVVRPNSSHAGGSGSIPSAGLILD